MTVPNKRKGKGISRDEQIDRSRLVWPMSLSIVIADGEIAAGTAKTIQKTKLIQVGINKLVSRRTRLLKDIAAIKGPKDDPVKKRVVEELKAIAAKKRECSRSNSRKPGVRKEKILKATQEAKKNGTYVPKNKKKKKNSYKNYFHY